jgi:phosphoribosylformimino-5-aminoimidazole carboxamide ribotide isomerase
VARIILGSAAVKDPAFARAPPAATFPGRVALGLDARDGFVATEGWAETSGTSRQRDLAHALRRQRRAAAIIYTDIARDGMLAGVQRRG